MSRIAVLSPNLLLTGTSVAAFHTYVLKMINNAKKSIETHSRILLLSLNGHIFYNIPSMEMGPYLCAFSFSRCPPWERCDLRVKPNLFRLRPSPLPRRLSSTAITAPATDVFLLSQQCQGIVNRPGPSRDSDWASRGSAGSDTPTFSWGMWRRMAGMQGAITHPDNIPHPRAWLLSHCSQPVCRWHCWASEASFKNATFEYH